MPGGGRIGKAQLVNDTGNERELEGAAGEVLFRNAQAGGGVALGQNLVGEPAQQQSDPFPANAAAAILFEIGLRKVKAVTGLCTGPQQTGAGRQLGGNVQYEAVDLETW